MNPKIPLPSGLYTRINNKPMMASDATARLTPNAQRQRAEHINGL